MRIAKKILRQDFVGCSRRRVHPWFIIGALHSTVQMTLAYVLCFRGALSGVAAAYGVPIVIRYKECICDSYWR
jgi:hypothetical protein